MKSSEIRKSQRTNPKKITCQTRKSPTTGSGLTRSTLTASACDCIIFRNYVLEIEKKNGRDENKICLKYIRSVQRLLLEGEKIA